MEALIDVSEILDERTCLGLVGESGSGKTTLGRVALGIERPDAGTVRFMGCDLHNAPRKDLRQVRRHHQVVLQDCVHSVNPRFKAREAVAEPLRNFEGLRSAPLRTRVGDLLEMVGLREEDGDKYPHQLSGGELQRVCIVRAIAPKPGLIVLDEAVSSLDMLIQKQVLELLSGLRRELRTAFLLIFHDIRVVRRVCDRVAVLDHGLIVERCDDMAHLDRLSHPASRSPLRSVLPALPR